MPCMGPSMPDDKEIDAVTQEVLDFLREKHRVHATNGQLVNLVKPSRERDNAKLRDAIKALLAGRNCEEF